MPKLIVMPGAGSPRSAKYVPVYEFLRQGGRRRQWDVEILDYHTAEVAEFGLSMPAAVAAVRDSLRSCGEGARLLARSFGCNVALAALSELPRDRKSCAEVVLWGAAPMEVYWSIFRHRATGIADYNARLPSPRAGALDLADSFFESLQPVEWLIRQSRQDRVVELEAVARIPTAAQSLAACFVIPLHASVTGRPMFA